MQPGISRRHYWLVFAAGIALAAGGCTSIFSRKPRAPASDVQQAALQTADDPIRIVYRTRTDRLNLAGQTLPTCCVAELAIKFPHPQGTPGMGSAVVRITPCTADATPFAEGRLSQLTGMFDDDSPGSAPTSVAGSTDVPLWQIDAIVAGLEKESFFRRSKALGAEVYLYVEADGRQHGKRVKPQPELDVLLLQAMRGQIAATPHGAEHGSTPTRPELCRLPGVETAWR
jgi:hypothetical protein